MRWLLLLLVFLLIGVASADVGIVNDTLFNLDNSAYIKVLAPQNSTNITIYNSTDTPPSSLQFYINGTPIRFTANTNKTLSNISYNNVTDVVIYTGNGTTSNLNVTARMKSSVAFYDFKVDGSTSQMLLSNESGWVTFNYTGWTQNQHNFEISQVSPPTPTPTPPPPPPPTPTPTPTPEAPDIISWGNNKTNNDSLTLTINAGEAVRFNATADQTIDTWNWFKDNINQNNNFDNFTTTFTAGTHTIKVNATNTNGASNTITWTVTVKTPPVPPNIISWSNSKTNNDSLTLTINTSEAVRFNATANQTINTWNWFKDNLNQNNNFDNFTTTFTAGTHTMKGNATNTNGTSNTITWSVTVLAIAGAPNITSWGNNKTNNDSLTLTINTSEAVRFNATANQTIATWNWYRDDLNQNNNYDNFTTTFTAGTHTMKVNATNTNGTSNTITWNVTTPAITIVINIKSPANNSINTTGYVNVTVTLDIPARVLLNWEGANESMNGAGTNFYKNKTGLLSGNYTFKVYANDSSGLSNVSETRTLVVNRTIVDNTIGSFINTSTFVINATVVITAPSGNVTVTIPNGTSALVDGGAVTSISIDSLAKVNQICVINLPSSDKLIENLSLGPEGAHFSPDIQARFNYTYLQIIPLGINESNLTVKFCNLATNSWETLAIFNRNTIDNYLIANISHFTTYALIGTAAAPTPVPVPGPVTGGGGGAGAISPEPLSNIDMFEITEGYLGANVPASYIYTTPNLVISEVLITPARNFGTTSIKVEMLKDLSNIVGVTPPSGIVYKYADIWTGAAELENASSIIDAFIGFKVDRGWLAQNNLEENSIRLLRWDGSKWNPLDTQPTSTDETFVYYYSKTTALNSPFAIVAVPLYPSATAQAIETPIAKGIIQKLIKPPAIEWVSRLWVYVLIALILLSLALYKLSKYQKRVIKVYEKAMEVEPENADAWYNKGIELHELGKYEEAIKAFDKAIEINPEYADAWYNKGFNLYELGNYEEATKSYDKAIEIIHKSRRQA